MHVLLIGRLSDIHLIRWCNGLAEKGIRISVATLHPLNSVKGLNSEVKVFFLPFGTPVGYILAALSLKRLYKSIKADFVHVHYAGGYGVLARLAGLKPLLLSVYGRDVLEAPFRSRLHWNIIKKNLLAATRIASTSEMMKKQVLEMHPTADVTITPFGVDTSVFKPQKSSSQKNKKITVGTVKKLENKYAIDILITGFALAVKSMPEIEFQLVIVGEGKERNSLIRLAKTLGVADKVTFTGVVPHQEVPEYLNHFDIFVAVSRCESESFGVAVVEASATGRPVIVSNVGGLPEVIVDGQTGIIIPKENPEALSEAILKLANNETLRFQMGEKGREFVQAYYEWNDSVGKMLNLYATFSTKNQI